METKILLENGTNEVEILEFIVDDNFYGINVAKIKEIINYLEPTPMPNSHPCVEGVFMPRDKMITAIDLKKSLQRGTTDKKGLFILTNFNQLDMAFHVDAVVGIHRVTWKDIVKPNATVSDAEKGVASGIVKINDKLIVILDFEKIVTDISPETGLKVSEIAALGQRNRCDVPIVIAEDSALLNKLIVDSLSQAGYENIVRTMNGQEAYDFIMKAVEAGKIKENVQCVITDIEMPLMDGHRLTYLLKNNDATKHIPIVIFSSLVNDEMRRKGESLGADRQLSKPEIGSLVKIIDELVGNNQ